MPIIQVHVSLTVGSEIGRSLSAGHTADAGPHHADGWPLGWGRLPGTRDGSGREAEAVVLMCEPALPGLVAARPIGVLRLSDAAAHRVLVCVAEEEPFLGLVDLAEHAAWDAEPAKWLRGHALAHPGGALGTLVDHGGRAEAAELVAELRIREA